MGGVPFRGVNITKSEFVNFKGHFHRCDNFKMFWYFSRYKQKTSFPNLWRQFLVSRDIHVFVKTGKYHSFLWAVSFMILV